MNNEKMFDLMEKMYSEMQNGFKNVNGRLDGVEGRLDGVEGRLDKLEKGQVILENKIEDTRKTLFDGYVQNSEAIKRIEEKIEYIQMDVNNLNMKTCKNENNIIEFTRHLKEVEQKKG